MTGKVETVYLPVKRYLTPEGKPTCANNFRTHNVCQFMLTRRFGTIDVCGVLCRDLDYYADDAWLQPHDNCPVWTL